MSLRKDFAEVYAEYFQEAEAALSSAMRHEKNSKVEKTREQKKKVQNDILDQVFDKFIGNFGDVDLKG